MHPLKTDKQVENTMDCEELNRSVRLLFYVEKRRKAEIRQYKK